MIHVTDGESNLSESSMSSSEYRHYLQVTIIPILRDEKKFEILNYLGNGSYGEVFSMKSPKYTEPVAVKMINHADTWIGEIVFWPVLKHPNILPLLEIMKLPQVDVFLMPLLYKDLETYMEEDDFLRNTSGFEVSKRWLREVLDALMYLHNKLLCHLDVKADNVLLDYDLKAVLCDFTFISSSVQVDRYGVPLPYRPPETCQAYDRDIPVDGVKFEVWSYGILALNIFTGHTIKKNIKDEVQRWHRDAYPLIYEAVQFPNFLSLMYSAFPSSTISDKDITAALNFVYFLIRFKPEDRPSLEEISNHIFLMKGDNAMEEPDPVWIFQDVSYCFCSCMEITKLLSKEFPRYKLHKSPRYGRRLKKKLYWKKKAKPTTAIAAISCVDFDAYSGLTMGHGDTQREKQQPMQKSAIVETALSTELHLNNLQVLHKSSHTIAPEVPTSSDIELPSEDDIQDRNLSNDLFGIRKNPHSVFKPIAVHHKHIYKPSETAISSCDTMELIPDKSKESDVTTNSADIVNNNMENKYRNGFFGWARRKFEGLCMFLRRNQSNN